MTRGSGIRRFVAVVAVAALAAGPVTGCSSKADTDARAHVDASLGALRDSATKMKTLKSALESFASAAPTASEDDFAARRGEVVKALDESSAAVAKARAEATAAKGVSGVSNSLIPKAADIVLGATDSIDRSLKSTRDALEQSMATKAAFSSVTGRATMAIAVAQSAIIDRAATFATQAADSIGSALGK